MADLYTPRQWADRISEYPTRRRLVHAQSGEEWLVDIAREEGAVHTEGDWLNAAALNGLETRLGTAFGTAGGLLDAHTTALAANEAALGKAAAQLDETTAALGAHAADTDNPHGVTIEAIGAAAADTLAAHMGDGENPHGVTAHAIGAAEATVLAAHMQDEENPHGVTVQAIGAAAAEALDAHVEDTHNPHGITREQLGAASEQSFTLHRAAMESLTAALEETAAAHTEALEEHSGRLDDAKDILDVHAAALTAQGSAINGQGERLDTLAATAAVAAERLDGLEGTAAAQAEALDGLQATATTQAEALAAHGEALEELGAALAGQAEALAGEVERLEGLIGTGGGGAAAEVWVNRAPGNAKFFEGVSLAHLQNLRGLNITWNGINDDATLAGYPGYLALNGANNFSVAFPLAVEGLAEGDSFELEFAGQPTGTAAKTATLTLCDDAGIALSGAAGFTITATPVRQAATLTATAACNGPVYLLYESSEGISGRGAQRIYTLRLLQQAPAAPEGPPLGANLYDPMGVGGDAFDAANHRLVGYSAGAAAAVAGGDTVLQAIAKLEARVAALGG